MNVHEIKAAVDVGKKVYWGGNMGGYEVIKDTHGQYFIMFTPTGNCIGLTWGDGHTLNGNESDFRIKD